MSRECVLAVGGLRRWAACGHSGWWCSSTLLRRASRSGRTNDRTPADGYGKPRLRHLRYLRHLVRMPELSRGKLGSRGRLGAGKRRPIVREALIFHAAAAIPWALQGICTDISDMPPWLGLWDDWLGLGMTGSCGERPGSSRARWAPMRGTVDSMLERRAPVRGLVGSMLERPYPCGGVRTPCQERPATLLERNLPRRLPKRSFRE